MRNTDCSKLANWAALNTPACLFTNLQAQIDVAVDGRAVNVPQ